MHLLLLLLHLLLVHLLLLILLLVVVLSRLLARLVELKVAHVTIVVGLVERVVRRWAHMVLMLR